MINGRALLFHLWKNHMENYLEKSATEILSSSYNDIFVIGNKEASKKIYKRLLKKWHPDMNKEDTSYVFIYITELFEKGETGLSVSTIEIDGYKFDYFYKRSNSLYDIYYMSSDKVMITFKQASQKLVKNYAYNYHEKIVKVLKGHPLESRYKALLNANIYSRGDLIQITLNDSNYIPLNLLLEHISDFKEYRISAYIVSRMFDLIMMYKHFGMSYVGFDPDMMFVNTVDHTIVDLSGLFYSHEHDSSMIALPPFLVPSVSGEDITVKKCSEKSSMNMLKCLATVLAGDTEITGSVALSNINANKEFIRIVSSFSDVKTSYEKWLDSDVKSLFKARAFYKKEVLLKDLMKYM